jgi:hypothetical protein
MPRTLGLGWFWMTSACLLHYLAGALGYIAREQTTKKTPPNNVITGTDHKENASTVVWLPIVECLSVSIATVVNTCHIAYSMHVTLFMACMHWSICNTNAFLFKRQSGTLTGYPNAQESSFIYY